MKAMILAAGIGSRLQPLTNTCPKPLISVAGKPLIVYHLEKLAKAGFKDIVINVHHLGDKIIEALGTGEKWNVSIAYSKESTLLETGGGICTALPLLGSEPFALINGDIWTDFDFANLPKTIKSMAHLILIDNPEHNIKGDFTLAKNCLLSRSTSSAEKTYTYSGIAVLDPNLFEGHEANTPFKLSPILDNARVANLLEGEYYSGKWEDVGTLARLDALNTALTLPL